MFDNQNDPKQKEKEGDNILGETKYLNESEIFTIKETNDEENHEASGGMKRQR